MATSRITSSEGRHCRECFCEGQARFCSLNWIRLEYFLDTFWTHLGDFWDTFGQLLGHIWDILGTLFGWIWSTLESLLGRFLEVRKTIEILRWILEAKAEQKEAAT